MTILRADRLMGKKHREKEKERERRQSRERKRARERMGVTTGVNTNGPNEI